MIQWHCTRSGPQYIYSFGILNEETRIVNWCIAEIERLKSGQWKVSVLGNLLAGIEPSKDTAISATYIQLEQAIKHKFVDFNHPGIKEYMNEIRDTRNTDLHVENDGR